MIELCSHYLSLWCIWLYVLFMLCTRFRVNPHSIVASMYSTIWPNRPSDWTVFSLLICTVHLLVCSFHVTYAFQSDSTLYNCLNIKELPPRRRRQIWRWSDCNWTRTQNYFVLKQTLNHLAIVAECLSCVVCTDRYCAFDCMFFSCHIRVSEWFHIQ